MQSNRTIRSLCALVVIVFTGCGHGNAAADKLGNASANSGGVDNIDPVVKSVLRTTSTEYTDAGFQGDMFGVSYEEFKSRKTLIPPKTVYQTTATNGSGNVEVDEVLSTQDKENSILQKCYCFDNDRLYHIVRSYSLAGSDTRLKLIRDTFGASETNNCYIGINYFSATILCPESVVVVLGAKDGYVCNTREGLAGLRLHIWSRHYLERKLSAVIASARERLSFISANVDHFIDDSAFYTDTSKGRQPKWEWIRAGPNYIHCELENFGQFNCVAQGTFLPMRCLVELTMKYFPSDDGSYHYKLHTDEFVPNNYWWESSRGWIIEVDNHGVSMHRKPTPKPKPKSL